MARIVGGASLGPGSPQSVSYGYLRPPVSPPGVGGTGEKGPFVDAKA